jgi:PAS domain S-box-containing protein
VIEEFGGRWYSTVKFPIDLQGRPRFLAGYTIDITDRKLAEEAVAAEKERLAVTLHSIGDGVITTDTHGRVDLLNRVAEKLTGWTQEEAQGQPLSEVFRIVHALTRQPRPSPFDQILAAGGTIELEGQTLLLARDGSERPVADSGAPIKDRHDNVIGVVLVFRDMTQEQRMLDNLRRIDKLDSLGVLAGGIAHDFNNLLCGILGHVDLARLLSRSHPEITHHLEAAISVFHRARDLTQQLLTFSKGGAPRRHTGRLDTVITQCVAFALSGSTIRCQPVIAPDLWLCDFDENQIGQVIDNLIINALQAMPQGGRLAVSARNHSLVEGEIPSLPAGRYVEVIVSDSGVGIPPELLGRIFDPFFTTKQKGNGLGLSICHSIMRKHDGFITVESVLGQGTTFHLYFPASQQAMPRDTTAPPLPHRGTGRILIMDDEECIRHVMRCMLSTMGYTVVEARHGQEALDLFAAAKESGEPFRAAFFDLTIPGGMGGRETIVAVRRTHPNLPIFASSGYSDDPAMAHPQEFGFTDSIGKPYRLADLADLLRRHLKVCPT